MSGRRFSRPAEPVAVGAPSPESIESALSLLLFLSNTKSQKTAKAMLEAMLTAGKANAQALEGFGPANRIADLQEAAEADRAAAAQELQRAKAAAGQMEQEAVARITEEREQLTAERSQLAERERAVEAGEQVLAEQRLSFETETAGLRKALVG